MNKKRKMGKGILLILFTLSINMSCYGWEGCKIFVDQDSSFFKKGDRVCFVGNSITNHGEFHHNIRLFYVTRYPDQPVNFYNCGISGDVTRGLLNRMDDDILIHKPTHVVIMIGMNDIRRALYGPREIFDADTLQMRGNAINNYRTNLEEIINIFLSKNIKVILQKPSIYDQTAVSQTSNSLGANDALKICADFIESLAKKYQLPTVDYWTLMNRINQQLQAVDPSATIVGKDRVHPGAIGHFVMTYQFLKSEGAPNLVSEICIAKGNQTKGKNCEVKSVRFKKNVVSFRAKENALPFPIKDNQRQALKLIPFMEDFNEQILKIADLQPGRYELQLDGTSIGEFTQSQLANGINLAEFETTPQFQQSLVVREILSQAWEVEGNLRNLKFIEYNQYYKQLPNLNNMAEVKSQLEAVFIEKYPHNSGYYISQLERYIANKPLEEEMRKELESLGEKAYEMAKPQWHNYMIIAVPDEKR